MQLMLRVDTTMNNGEVKTLDILIDTGAEANLVRTGLVPRHLTTIARTRLNLVTANGQTLGGGERTTDLRVRLRQEVDGVSLDELLEYDIEFFEADIQVDAILSYPWLFDNRIGLFPHHSALALDSPQLILLYGVNKTRRRGLQQVWERIDTTPTHEPKGRRRQRKRRERERRNWDWEQNCKPQHFWGENHYNQHDGNHWDHGAYQQGEWWVNQVEDFVPPPPTSNNRPPRSPRNGVESGGG